MSAQEAVELTAVPSRTMELEASELPGFIAGLPRILTEKLSIALTGIYAGTITIERFYGPGSLHISGSGGTEIQGSIMIMDCASRISIYHVKVSAGNGLDGVNLITVDSSMASFKDIEFSGSGTGDVIGIRTQGGATAMLFGSIMHDLHTAVMASGPSVISVYDVSASNNGTGASAYRPWPFPI